MLPWLGLAALAGAAVLAVPLPGVEGWPPLVGGHGAALLPPKAVGLVVLVRLVAEAWPALRRPAAGIAVALVPALVVWTVPVVLSALPLAAATMAGACALVWAFADLAGRRSGRSGGALAAFGLAVAPGLVGAHRLGAEIAGAAFADPIPTLVALGSWLLPALVLAARPPPGPFAIGALRVGPGTGDASIEADPLLAVWAVAGLGRWLVPAPAGAWVSLGVGVVAAVAVIAAARPAEVAPRRAGAVPLAVLGAFAAAWGSGFAAVGRSSGSPFAGEVTARVVIESERFVAEADRPQIEARLRALGVDATVDVRSERHLTVSLRGVSSTSAVVAALVVPGELRIAPASPPPRGPLPEGVVAHGDRLEAPNAAAFEPLAGGDRFAVDCSGRRCAAWFEGGPIVGPRDVREAAVGRDARGPYLEVRLSDDAARAVARAERVVIDVDGAAWGHGVLGPPPLRFRPAELDEARLRALGAAMSHPLSARWTLTGLR